MRPIINAARQTVDENLGIQDFKNMFYELRKMKQMEMIQTALVMDVDRVGGRFIINKSGANNMNNVTSPPLTLKIRLLTNMYNASDGDDNFIDIDEYFALPLGSPNIIDIPARGEYVKILVDKPFDASSNITLYWIGRALEYATSEYTTTFKKRDPLHEKSVTHSELSIYSGNRPQIIDKEYDISPNPDIAFPENIRLKPEDVFLIGKSNTIVRESFSTYKENNSDNADRNIDNNGNQFPLQDDEKEGYLEFATGLSYIPTDDTKDLIDKLKEFSYSDSTKRSGLSIDEFNKIKLEHFKRHYDPVRSSSKWEFLNSKTKLILASKLNVDARLIHKDTEKDWTGKFGNVQKLFDKHFRDEGKGSHCGDEILNEHLQFNVEFDTKHGDVLKVESNERGPIHFDENIESLMAQAKVFRFVSPDGNNMNHAVLAEEQGRFIQKLLLILLHQNRTIDIINSRLHLLSVDFLKHFHAVLPSQTQEPLGLSNPKDFIKNKPWYEGTTSDDVASDSTFDENGADAISMKIKERTKEERKLFEELIREIPNHHSKVFTIN
jgi:hypothetical protein